MNLNLFKNDRTSAHDDASDDLVRQKTSDFGGNIIKTTRSLELKDDEPMVLDK